MYSIRQLMQEKKDFVSFEVEPEATVLDALKLMSQQNIGAVMVVAEGQMVGIFTERDFARKAIESGKCTMSTPVRDVMTQHMITVNPEQSLEDCMKLMSEHRIRHLPVMEGGRLCGMVSMRDVVEAIISRKDSTIEKLESYILGKDYGR
jgi:CBS domain-containing protein